MCIATQSFHPNVCYLSFKSCHLCHSAMRWPEAKGKFWIDTIFSFFIFWLKSSIPMGGELLKQIGRMTSLPHVTKGLVLPKFLLRQNPGKIIIWNLSKFWLQILKLIVKKVQHCKLTTIPRLIAEEGTRCLLPQFMQYVHLICWLWDDLWLWGKKCIRHEHWRCNTFGETWILKFFSWTNAI